VLAQERRSRIVEILHQRENGLASVAELSEAFGVSTMTVRRDLDWLEGRGLLRRVRGGAVRYPGLIDEKSFRERGGEASQEKQAIGWTAAQLVRDGDRIILDAGTTTLQVARNLTDRRDVTAVTNALPVAEELAQCPHVSTILLGGMLKQRELCTVGPPVTSELSHLSVDKVFLSAAGFSLEKGAMDPDLREAEVKQAMIQAASEVILVADSGKWGVTALVQVTPLDAIDVLVTDDGISPEAVEAIEAEGVEVVTPARAGRTAPLRRSGFPGRVQHPRAGRAGGGGL